jgi:hypothetical protein
MIVRWMLTKTHGPDHGHLIPPVAGEIVAHTVNSGIERESGMGGSTKTIGIVIVMRAEPEGTGITPLVLLGAEVDVGRKERSIIGTVAADIPTLHLGILPVLTGHWRNEWDYSITEIPDTSLTSAIYDTHNIHTYGHIIYIGHGTVIRCIICISL